MRSFRSRKKWLAFGLGICVAALAVSAELPSWSEDIIAGNALEAALFRIMGVPGGVVTHIRPPWEARSHLTSLIEKSPHDAELYSIRAREEERLQDYSAAEADWKQAAANGTDRVAGLSELADFYHRRVEPEQQLSTLLQLGALPAQPGERFQPDSQQPQWAAFQQATTVANDALLSRARYETIFNAWIKRYPRDTEPYQAYLNWCVQRKYGATAALIAARIKKTFANDLVLVVSTDASLARVEKGPQAALAVYSQNFSPLWPDSLKRQYFQALSEAHQLREFLTAAQASIAEHPTDLAPVLRLYFYYEQQNRKDAADQQLLMLNSRRAAQNAPWTPAELKTIAPLFSKVQDYDESAHSSYMLYEMPAASAIDKEWALASIISLLLEVPERPLLFGNRDLSLYKNVARMDRHPGFLNGILSLALNTTFPEFQYQNASQSAVSYFHRASASALIDLLEQQFPNSPHAAALEANLFRAYAVYGQHDAVIRSVPAWLNRNRDSEDYVDLALLLADAYVATERTQDEIAIYDRLLAELSEKSEHMPIGAEAVSNQVHMSRNPVTPDQQAGPRSPNYTRVLDRYISRLVQLNRNMDAVRLLRREIDRNPDDPGIYERLALFVEQNQLNTDVEQTYRDALAHFKDMSWASKLARFYLRQKQYAAYQDLTRQITDTFKGSQVAAFVEGVPLTSPVLFRQINLYAHQRFPQNLVFVRNLMQAYNRKETLDRAAYEQLLREYWYYDPGFRTAFFEYLSRSGGLQQELAALPELERAAKESNLAALEFRAEGHAWLTDYEAAAPAFTRLAALAPGNRQYNNRAISVERSLSPEATGAFDSAIRLAEQDVKSTPGDFAAITRVGEIYADREMYAQARPWWNRVATVQPGSPEGYLDSATVFWDYFQFGDALRVISQARRTLNKRFLFSYEAGAIYENQGKYREAIAAYIEGALHDSSEQAKSRLITLASRKPTAALVEQSTATLTAAGFESTAFQLRLSILEKLNRRQETGNLLATLIPRAATVNQLSEMQGVADRLGFDDLTAQALVRTVSLTVDPIEKMQSRIELARFYETHNQAARAQSEFSSLLDDHPNVLGVIRAAVDFYWREKQGVAAVQTLEAAASRAAPPYQNDLRREAAQKATDSGQFQEARSLLDQLLANDSYNGDLLAAKAATYSRGNDSSGLVAFYAAELKSMQSASLPPQEKTTRIAALRRGYILALISVGQFREALENYEQVLNAFPEDASLANEVSRFAESHQLAAPLTAYYEKAASDSPRDYRWPLVLARVDTALRRYPEAVTAYNKAAYVRPDRLDIVSAKVDLETRLLRFQDAIASYQKLYELSYHDTEYLAAQAQTYARMGNKTEAMRLLRAAYIDPRPREASGYAAAMEQAANWHWFHEVDELFGQARPLLIPKSFSTQQALRTEAVALVSLHKPADAINLIAASVESSVQAQSYVIAMGTAMRAYLTPAEKIAFIQSFDKPGALPPPIDKLQLAQTAGFADIEANLLAKAAESDVPASVSWQTLNRVQSSRLTFDQLGRQLEAVAQWRSRMSDHSAILEAAFQAYKKAGDVAAELRLVAYARGDFPRLFVSTEGDLSRRLSYLAAHNPKRAYSVVDYLIANGSPDQAIQAIAACGAGASDLWRNAYTGLAGLYFLSPANWTGTAFEHALGPRSVGAGISDKSQPDELRGADWFYYAARYGDYLGYRRLAGAQDYLPASLEANPAASDSYVQLADTYREMKQPARAAELYENALQLSPTRADVYDRLALLAINTKQREQAIARWRRAFQLLAAQVEQGPLPTQYWQTAETVLIHMNEFGGITELKPDADAMLRAYAKRNGAYNFTPFLRGMFGHAADQKAALAWAIEISKLPNMDVILGELLSANWIPEADKEVVYQEKIERDRKALSAAIGSAPVAQASMQLTRDMADYARYLGSLQRWSEEWNVLEHIDPVSERPADLVLISGALTGHLDELLKGYRSMPETAPPGDRVLAVASSLQRLAKHELALEIEQFEYERELAVPSAPASAWFGLAKVRFDQKRNDEALSLIRDVTLSVGAPFENMPEAVRVLENAGLKDEAARYAAEWRTAEPWNEQAQLAFGRLKPNPALLNDIRRSPDALYSTRATAARLLRDMGTPADGADELALLTHKRISASEASQPFYVEARLDAAQESSLPAEKIRLYSEAIALDPRLLQPRLDLAQAALMSGRDALGLAAFSSYQTPSSGEFPGADYQPTFERAPMRETVPQPANLFAVEQLAAEALTRQDAYGEALQLYNALLNTLEDPAKRDQIRKVRDSVMDKENLEAANAARQPRVGKALTQDRIVKPKLKILPADWVLTAEAGPAEEH